MSSLLAVGFGVLIAAERSRDGEPNVCVASLLHFDARHYQDIVENGYSYAPDRRSNVAFFPAFPLTARALSDAMGISSIVALLAVANGCLAGAMLLFARYLAVRSAACSSGDTEVRDERATVYALWAFALLPTTFFFHMPYAEAMFVCATIAALYAIERGWPLHWTGTLVGLCTVVRPVGVALLLPLAWRVVRGGETWGVRVRRLSWVLPLGCWGLLSYIAYQYAVLGDPLAFAKTQTHWRKSADLGLADKALSLSSWEPIWSVYVPGAPGYFGGFADGTWTHRMRFFNPIFFGGTVALVLVGAWKRWLNAYEILLAVGLLAIPYLTRAHEMCMESQGRFAAVVLPVYVVLGQVLARLPRLISLGLLVLSALGLGFFSSRFAAGYLFF